MSGWGWGGEEVKAGRKRENKAAEAVHSLVSDAAATTGCARPCVSTNDTD